MKIAKPTTSGVLLGVALGFGLGAAFGIREPAVRVETVEIEKKVEQVKAVEQKNETASKVEHANERRRVERVSVEKPDGTRVVREVVTSEAVKESAEQTVRVEVREVERVVVQDREVVKTVEPVLRNWRAGPMVGLDLQRASLLPPSPGRVLFGAHAERRVVGPVWLGAWGLNSGVVGVSVSVEF